MSSTENIKRIDILKRIIGKVLKYPIVISAGLFLAGWVLLFVFKYKQLSKGEGWGVIVMIGILICGLLFFAIISLVVFIVTLIIGVVKKNRNSC